MRAAVRVPLVVHVAAVALTAGDMVVLQLPWGDEICDIRRIVRPGASQIVLIDYRLASGATGTLNLLGTDPVLRIKENAAVAA